ncbi:hypothetical protein E3N88_31029 [Mikania micrantha]|uniref:Uncharacterized protein n=1 Tax=Mikania micrantha TaxID=192012 RepID=A0A5N6MN96_9ASTR|nr:hypothetical protein E3N88_31029 [Mikania micrantha]
MCLVFVCDEDERIVGQQQAPGACPYCGGLIKAMDVESQWRLCFLPLYYKTKRKGLVFKWLNVRGQYLLACKITNRGNNNGVFNSHACGEDQTLNLQNRRQRKWQRIQDLEALPTWKETKLEDPIGDGLTKEEEHPLHGNIYEFILGSYA